MVQGIAIQNNAGLNRMVDAYRAPTGRVQTWNAVALVLAAVLAALAVCWPSASIGVMGEPVWWLQLIAMAVLCHVLGRSNSAKQAFGWAMLFTTTWLGATFWWLYVAMHTYGGLPSALAFFAVLALAAALSLYYGAAMALYWRLAQGRPVVGAFLFAALWTMAEMARGTWLTGFGWGAMAYAHTQGPLAIWIPLVGAYGVGAVAAWLAATLAVFAKAGWGQRITFALLLLASTLPLGIQSTTSTGTIQVALLQGNIPQDEKFDSGTGIPLALRWYAEHMQQRQADLVLAPETAIPLLPQELPEGYWDSLNRQVQQGHSALLTGIPLGDYKRGYTNAVIALQPGPQPVWQYAKHHLVPFGEFIPPLFKWFTRMMNIPLGDFERGAIGQPSFPWRGQRIAPNICYEDLFGEELGARFADPASAPTVFANVSNLGWFGDTIAIDQHLQISKMRALEFQRPFLRATNTGATVIMDYQGHVAAGLPRLTAGVLEGRVEGRTGITPFAWWVSRWGLWPLWLLALMPVLLAWPGLWPRRQSTTAP